MRDGRGRSTETPSRLKGMATADGDDDEVGGGGRCLPLS